MDDPMRAWCRGVAKHIRFRYDREAVEEELYLHLEESRDDRMEAEGLSREAAEAEAIAAMGDPVALGKELDQVHGPLLGWTWRLSRVLVRDRWSGRVEAVDNAGFLARGGRARRVITMPERSSYQAMRYTGQFQLDKSASQLQRLEITVAEPFAAWPGDLVRVGRTGWDWNGLYRAVQVTTAMDESGYWSRLELADPDFTV